MSIPNLYPEMLAALAPAVESMKNMTPQRLAAFLLRLSAQQGPQMELPSSQRQVAAHLGVRAETLSRLLSEWQARQWLRGERRHWTLLDTAPLQQLAGALARSF